MPLSVYGVPETSRVGLLQSFVTLVQVRGLLFRAIASTTLFCTRMEAVTFVTVEPMGTLAIR